MPGSLVYQVGLGAKARDREERSGFTGELMPSLRAAVTNKDVIIGTCRCALHVARKRGGNDTTEVSKFIVLGLGWRRKRISSIYWLDNVSMIIMIVGKV